MLANPSSLAPHELEPDLGSGRSSLVKRLHRLRDDYGVEIILLLVIGVAIPALIALHYGALGAPSADDWAYDLSAFHFASHGNFDLYHFGPSNMVGQLVLVAPFILLFGAHIWVLNLWTCLIGFAGLVALDVLARHLGLSRKASLFCVAVLGLGPMWASLSASFMLDIPSLALMTIALAIAAGDHRVDRIVTRRSVAALTVAAVAFTIRDETVIAIAAIALCRLWRAGRPTLRASWPWLGVVGTLGAVLLAFQAWRLSVPTGGHGYAVIPPAWQWNTYQWLLPLAGLLLIPAAAIIGPLRVVRAAMRRCRRPLFITWAILPGLPLIGFVGHISEEIQTYGFASDHAFADFTPGFGDFYFTPSNFGTPTGDHTFIYLALLALALLSVVAAMVVEASCVLAVQGWVQRVRFEPRLPSQDEYVAVMLGIVVVGSWAIFAIGIKWDLQAWDRYLLPMAAYTTMLAMYQRQKDDPSPNAGRWNARLGMGGLSILAALGALSTLAVEGLNGFNWNYSNSFAASQPNTPPSLIYTSWVWTSMKNSYMVSSDLTFNMEKNYVPCFTEQANTEKEAGELDFQEGGSWVEPVTYAMVPNNQELGEAHCHQATTTPSRPASVTSSPASRSRPLS